MFSRLFRLRGSRPESQPLESETGVHAADHDISVESLLQQAARCYARATWNDDACRLYVETGNYQQAAAIYERMQLWPQAAVNYERAGSWAQAANCYLRYDQMAQAAECLARGGQTLQAAWLWAHSTRQYVRARMAVGGVVPRNNIERASIDLIEARCDAAAGSTTEAAYQVRSVLMYLQSALREGGWRLIEWAFATAQVLQRPDLIQQIYSTAVAAGNVQAREQWEVWARQAFGDASAVPLPDHVAEYKG